MVDGVGTLKNIENAAVSEALGRQVGLGMAVLGAFGRQVGSGTAVFGALGRQLALGRQAGVARAGRAGLAGVLKGLFGST